ncbi:hypothetical protein SLV14_000976 [Streptomyces sp. Je 1-4]|uniref:hypothetical protein n=1 Tax=Streptomyces TaxID=1883 RepID=UPI0021DA9708|nr:MULTISPECIES: hypothetical protein [unclassified Streptomyces]UYB38595.1 hypothetical protein SLV14_000976 [Streptomyces sp. Je 1-4]UZQ34563.1 hypothetical protein SLV14N_000976 [Streptomyces sp. Je 1-4] [Streptomyces sp. Je 1-4 4N24]UZQ41981.1 hypothetical protein SLV14NA_000976 [Streptomyces sp. Je 1-4] [Streptomyces sp. Je 1-4 4N24_ara]
MTGTSPMSPHHERLRSFTINCDGETLSCAAIEPPRKPTSPRAPLAAVVLHGAGTGDKTRHTALLTDFAARGHHALACDFSGHTSRSRFTRLVHPGTDHRLGSWFAENSGPRGRFVDTVLRGTPYECTPPLPRPG